MATKLNARLDKTGMRVLCGRRGCRGHLASIEEYALPSDWKRVERWLSFPMGWVEKPAGHWELTHHAKQRLDRSNREMSAGIRNAPKRLISAKGGKVPDAVRAALPAVPGGRSPREDASAHEPRDLPVGAKCPVCGYVNLLHRDALRLTRPLAIIGLAQL